MNRRTSLKAMAGGLVGIIVAAFLPKAKSVAKSQPLKLQPVTGEVITFPAGPPGCRWRATLNWRDDDGNLWRQEFDNDYEYDPHIVRSESENKNKPSTHWKRLNFSHISDPRIF